MELLAEVIRHHYDVGEVGSPQWLEDAHQRRHRKLVVHTAAGKFLVKTYKNDAIGLDALRFQHRLSDHLLENGVPVARIERTRDGKGIVEMETWALELQQFVEGEPMQVNSATLAASAKALGRFHQVCRDFPRPPRDTQMWRFSEVPRTAFSKLFELAQKEGDAQRATQWCNDIALFLHDAAKELSREMRNKFETGLIHGDWHGGNLLFQEDELVAVVDLEFAGDGCYLEDMAYAISNLCIRTSNSPERLRTRFNILSDNYSLSRSLSFYEQVALPYAVAVKHVATVSYQITQLGGKVAGYTAYEWLERLAEQCAWLSERARMARFGR